MTTRLFQIVQAIGLATGGMLGARLADRFRMETSWMTILRRMMALPTEPVKQVSQLGIDDFAFRRGCKYGTILVDMITHKVIDMLPDRTSATSAAWMAAHPEIELVSRDRGGDYASAAREGAPQAIQCADRFHLLKNLGETLEGVLARHLAARRTCQTEKLSATPVRVKARAGEDGRLFGSITVNDLAKELQARAGTALDRRQIHLAEPIRSVGTHEVTVHLRPEVNANVTVEVVAE